MEQSGKLSSNINKISGRGYKAYKDIKGVYEYEREGFILYIDYVQGDPFASPSKIRVKVPQSVAGFPAETFSGKSREVALRDFLSRSFYHAIKKYAQGGRGSGKSGLIHIDGPGQEVLERTSMFVDEAYVEARFTIGLPAFGRRIAGREAHYIFFTELPDIIEHSLKYENLPQETLHQYVQVNEDAHYLRNQLKANNIVAFVAEHAILPRKSGISNEPMQGGEVVPFEAPESMRFEVNLPNYGPISGMGIPEGITLIVGGGFHGKSTLLTALEQGIYNHIPGDGREYVVTNSNAVKIRAEDGRRIEQVNISPFINNLPFNKSTHAFSSEDASGSTSQAANIIEALEAGAESLLIDEDTSATNFMVRDARMQKLISKEAEPITPFVDKIRQLYNDHGISTILVMGGSGDYFEEAGHIIGMHEYKPYDYSGKVREIVARNGQQRVAEGGHYFGAITPRYPLGNSVDASRGRKQKRIRVSSAEEITFGNYVIDLLALEQLVDKSQANAIGEALVYARQYMDGYKSMKEVAENVLKDVEEEGLNIVGATNAGNYAAFRKQDFLAALNRLRSLTVTSNTHTGQ